ncbi:MAG: hypothetical protein RLZZ498_1712 [Pseudomonadota bacterium]|jgi:hypothetical protein
MKKTFQLHVEGKHPDRVLDAIKHEIRKYLKRERRRDLPEGVDYWDFDCKFGLTEEAAEAVHLANVIACIDNAVANQAQQFYVEILAKHGVRAKRPAGELREHQERHGLDGFDDSND